MDAFLPIRVLGVSTGVTRDPLARAWLGYSYSHPRRGRPRLARIGVSCWSAWWDPWFAYWPACDWGPVSSWIRVSFWRPGPVWRPWYDPFRVSFRQARPVRHWPYYAPQPYYGPRWIFAFGWTGSWGVSHGSRPRAPRSIYVVSPEPWAVQEPPPRVVERGRPWAGGLTIGTAGWIDEPPPGESGRPPRRAVPRGDAASPATAVRGVPAPQATRGATPRAAPQATPSATPQAAPRRTTQLKPVAPVSEAQRRGNVGAPSSAPFAGGSGRRAEGDVLRRARGGAATPEASGGPGRRAVQARSTPRVGGTVRAQAGTPRARPTTVPAARAPASTTRSSRPRLPTTRAAPASAGRSAPAQPRAASSRAAGPRSRATTPPRAGLAPPRRNPAPAPSPRPPAASARPPGSSSRPPAALGGGRVGGVRTAVPRPAR